MSAQATNLYNLTWVSKFDQSLRSQLRQLFTVAVSTGKCSKVHTSGFSSGSIIAQFWQKHQYYHVMNASFLQYIQGPGWHVLPLVCGKFLHNLLSAVRNFVSPIPSCLEKIDSPVTPISCILRLLSLHTDRRAASLATTWLSLFHIPDVFAHQARKIQ